MESVFSKASGFLLYMVMTESVPEFVFGKTSGLH